MCKFIMKRYLERIKDIGKRLIHRGGLRPPGPPWTSIIVVPAVTEGIQKE